MKNAMNILFTSVGRRSYLIKYFKEAINGNGEIYVANSSEISPAFQVADYSVVTPLIYDANYIPFLLNYCKDHHIGAIISLFDIDLPILAKNKEKFEEIGTAVIVSEESVIEICNDKWKTFQFLKTNGFCAPETFISLESVYNALESGKIHFPLMLKPRWGMGSIAVFEADNEEELKVLYKKAKRNIQNTYLKFESEQNMQECVLIQEKLDGNEYGLDVINNLQGIYQTTIVKKKYAMRSGETDCAVTVANEALKTIGSRLSGILHHVANLDVDVFVNEKGNYVLEMNARFGGGYPFSHMAGVNLPFAIIQWLRGEDIDKTILTEHINVMAHKDINLVLI